MVDIKSRDSIIAFPGSAVVLWKNGCNAVIVLENYGLKGQWYLKLREAQIRTKAAFDRPLVYNQKEIDKAKNARRLRLEVPVPEPQVEDVELLPEFQTLEAYQQAVDEWTAERSNWFHKFGGYSNDGYFYLLIEHSDEEGDLFCSLPLRVRLADGRVAAFEPCVEIKSTYWFGTTNRGLYDEDLTQAIERYNIPCEVVILCNGIVAAMKAHDDDLERQNRGEREAAQAKRDDEDRRKLAEEFGVPLPEEK